MGGSQRPAGHLEKPERSMTKKSPGSAAPTATLDGRWPPRSRAFIPAKPRRGFWEDVVTWPPPRPLEERRWGTGRSPAWLLGSWPSPACLLLKGILLRKAFLLLQELAPLLLISSDRPNRYY